MRKEETDEIEGERRQLHIYLTIRKKIEREEERKKERKRRERE